VVLPEDENTIENILDVVVSTFGMVLPETHYRDVVSFLRKRMEERNEDISGYVHSLWKDRDEYIRFVDAITINESYFFRDGRHFSLLYNEILSRLFSKRRHVKIWSAASAAGEEAVSLAALCNTLLRSNPGTTYTIYASDINAAALEKMKNGRYTKSAFREDGSEFHSFLLPYITENDSAVTADETIRERIVVCEHNLFHDDYSPFPDDFDLVLLRNVFIYMPMENRNKILRHIVSKTREGGYLFLSASEVPLIWHPTLKIEERNGIYFFRRSVAEREIEKRDVRPPDVRPAPAEEKVNTRKIYETINHLLYNPLYEKEDTPEGALAGMFVSLIAAVNLGDIGKCENLLNLLEKELPENEAVLYYRGIMEKLRGKGEHGKKYLEHALRVQQQFWPAGYELAMLLKETDGKKARRQFASCKKYIQMYIEKGEYTYHFLLDGFNALYFLKICTFWEQKLGGSVHGTR
jgi:chemotaxis protein methyltransferase CheR